MSYHTYTSSQYSPPSHASSLSSSSSTGSHSSYGSTRKFPPLPFCSVLFCFVLHACWRTPADSSILARYEAAKSFDLEDDLEYCPALTMDEVRQYYDDVTAKSIFFPNLLPQQPPQQQQFHHSPPSQSSSPSPPHNYIHPSPPHMNVSRLAVNDPSTAAFRPPSRSRGTAAIKIIDPNTREERRRYY